MSDGRKDQSLKGAPIEKEENLFSQKWNYQLKGSRLSRVVFFFLGLLIHYNYGQTPSLCYGKA